MLSQYIRGLKGQYCISDRWEREIISAFRKKELLDSLDKVAIKLPDGYDTPYITINKKMLQTCGLTGALVLSYSGGRIKELNEKEICGILGISRATFYNCKRKLRLLDKRTIENLFKEGDKMIDVEEAKKKVTNRHLKKFSERIKKAPNISNLFLALCSSYGYKQVPRPSRADIAKAKKAMQNTDIPVAEVLERLVSNWHILQTIKHKAKFPDLGALPICFKEVLGMQISPKLKKQESKELEDDTQHIDDYIEEAYFD